MKYKTKYYLTEQYGRCNVICWETEDLYLQEINIKASEVCKISTDAFGKAVYSFPLLS